MMIDPKTDFDLPPRTCFKYIGEELEKLKDALGSESGEASCALNVAPGCP